MRTPRAATGWWFLILAAGAWLAPMAEPAESARFTRLTPLPAPRIVETAQEFPSPNFIVGHLIDGNPKTEFASAGKGTNTFVVFDFGKPVRIGGFRHQDRNDPAIIAESELVFSDAAGKHVGQARVAHINRRGGITFLGIPEPVTAQRVRWQVTKLSSPHGTVGGAEIQFFTAAQPESKPAGIGIEAQTASIIERKGNTLTQPLRVTLDYPYAEPLNAIMRVEGQEARPVELKFGTQTL